MDWYNSIGMLKVISDEYKPKIESRDKSVMTKGDLSDAGGGAHFLYLGPLWGKLHLG